MAKTRRIVQIVFLLFFIILFFKSRYPYEDVSLSGDLGLRFSPLIPLFDFIDSWSLSWRYWPALLILFFTPFFGRFFCGWICPLGTTIDAGSKIVKSPSNKLSEKWQKLRFFKFAFLAAFIIMAIFSVNGWGYFDPLSIFNRSLSIVLYPLATFFTENSLLGISNLPFMEDAAYWVYDPFKDYIMPENQAAYQHVIWIAVFFFVVVGLEKVSRRFWCRNICPAGAWLGILSQFRFYERIVGPACPSCNKCQVECKMNAIPDGDVTQTDKVECIECFNCGEVCPPKFNAISYRWRWKPYYSSVDYNRRQFLKTSAGSAAALGLIGIGLNNKNDQEIMIRPPGSLPEDEFRDRCIRCMECVRICESNGGCLQPDQIHNSVLDLWLPVAKMRGGYCEYNCNLCGQVCPTEAILPMSLADKKKLPMGLAHFDKNLCIPFDRNEDCIVCEEHCPTPDKAIKFNVKELALANGNIKKVKYPYVIKDLCIGCGICEDKCPLVGKAGIFVNTENQQRMTKEGAVQPELSPYG